MDYKTHFNECWPNEGCGYMKNGEFFPLKNEAENPLTSFVVNPSFLIEEPDLLLHSHTVGHTISAEDDQPHAPSYEDLKGQIDTGIEWGICVTDGEICEEPICWGNPENRPELLGRQFIFNIQDCLTLCQDWFYKEKGIIIKTQPRTHYWFDEGENYMEDLYESWGFKRIELTDLQHGDILFYKVRSQVVNHLGIYMGDNKVLSHWYQRTSCIEDFGKWADYIMFAARYQE
jgi:proteasome lid subunit RPN8/RPN11